MNKLKNETTEKNNYLAVEIPQELATEVDNAATKFGVESIFSRIGCEIGLLLFYAEFNDCETKKAFLDTIKNACSTGKVLAS